MPSTAEDVLRTLVKVWLKGQAKMRIAIGFAAILGVASFVLYGLATDNAKIPFISLHPILVKAFAYLGAAIALVIVASVFGIQRYAEEAKGDLKIAEAEQRLRENPKEPQLAWDVAREKLERYLNRNLSQVRSIFLLTVFVMLVGFGLIGFGAYEAFHAPGSFSASVLSAVSGVVVSFIGGTFLVLYKATMEQASDYVTILERINAVGMSVQILNTLDEDPALKRQSTAEVAKELLHMYAGGPAKFAGLRNARAAPKAK
jgi:hypothetical protein